MSERQYDLPASLTTDQISRLAVSRLNRLIKIRDKHLQELNQKGKKLLVKAIFSAYLYCCDTGIQADFGQVFNQDSEVTTPDLPDKQGKHLMESGLFKNETTNDTWQLICLSRFRRLVKLRSRHYVELNLQGRKLIDESIFSVYYDCRTSGVEAETNSILQGVKALAVDTS